MVARVVNYWSSGGVVDRNHIEVILVTQPASGAKLRARAPIVSVAVGAPALHAQRAHYAENVDDQIKGSRRNCNFVIGIRKSGSRAGPHPGTWRLCKKFSQRRFGYRIPAVFTRSDRYGKRQDNGMACAGWPPAAARGRYSLIGIRAKGIAAP